MKELVDIYTGTGIIHLTGSPSETILYIKKEPRLACFFAEVGTVWRYHMGQEINEDLLRDNYEYERLVKDGQVDPQKPLSEQFKHLTNLLTNGSYSLQLCKFPWQLRVLPGTDRDNTKSFYDTYGGTADLIETQSYLNRQVVDTYKTAIACGVRPIVVLIKLEASWVIYILDGHHKLQAYQELKKDPEALIISKLDPKRLTVEQALGIMQKIGLTEVKFIETYQEERNTNQYQENFYNHYSKGLNTYFK